MAATPQYYANLVEGFRDTESLTVLFAAGSGVKDVATALEVDLEVSIELDDVVGSDTQATGWALVDVPGGVLAVEPTGFGDPTLPALIGLSRNGRASAVVRNNLLAHLRFGCARHGRLLFDDNEYMYVPDPSVVPEELRALFDLAWQDLDDDPNDDDASPSGFAVALAMAEAITGVAVTSNVIGSLQTATYHPAPMLLYAQG